MKTRIFEATNGAAYGKFLVGRFDEEWRRFPQVEDENYAGVWPGVPLLRREGWEADCFLLLDLSNPGVGAIFVHNPHSVAEADVEKLGLSICWLYTDFLKWVYQQKLDEFDQWPSMVKFELLPAREVAPSGK